MADHYNPADNHDPLFEVDGFHLETAGPGLELSKKDQKVAIVDRGLCPGCNNDKKTGLVRQGSHLVWRIHDRLIGSGARIPCHTSGIPVCEAPARPGDQVDHQPACSHVRHQAAS